MSFHTLLEIRRSNAARDSASGTPDVVDDVPDVDGIARTATPARPPRQYPEEPPDTAQCLDERDPLYPIDTHESTPGLLKARILAGTW